MAVSSGNAHHRPGEGFTLSRVYADDQSNALPSCTQMLSSTKKTKIRVSQARWLITVPLDDRNHPAQPA